MYGHDASQVSTKKEGYGGIGSIFAPEIPAAKRGGVCRGVASYVTLPGNAP